jgi:glycosyltransferase involved in cell wall biosynthesis
VADRPSFSVVIAAHNAASTLPAAVRSVLNQTCQDFEIIVVDDGSIDDTRTALRRVTDRRVVYLRQDNLGPAAARNAGIEHAIGRYVSILDSDDLWLPQYLESMTKALEPDPLAAMAYTDAWRLDDETRRIYRRTIMSSQNPPDPPPNDPHTFLQALLERNFVYCSATVRRSILDEVGGFTPISRSEDYELWLRIAARRKRIVRAKGVLAIYRDRTGSRSADPVAMYQGRCDIYRLVLETYNIPPNIRELAHSRLNATQRELSELNRQRSDAQRKSWQSSAPIRLLRDRRMFYRRPPAPVAAAFPDLRLI